MNTALFLLLSNCGFFEVDFEVCGATALRREMLRSRRSRKKVTRQASSPPARCYSSLWISVLVYKVPGDGSIEEEGNGENGDVVAFQAHCHRSISCDSVEVHLTAAHYKYAGFERLFCVAREYWSILLRAKLPATLKCIDRSRHELHARWEFTEHGEGLDD